MLQLKSATGVIAIVTVAVSAFAIFSGLDNFVYLMGFIPARLSGVLLLPGALPAVLTPLSSALVHGSWIHLAINIVMRSPVPTAFSPGADIRKTLSFAKRNSLA